MNALRHSRLVLPLAAALLSLALGGGCAGPWARARAAYRTPAPPATLGTVVDQINQMQEANAERSDFVIYQHEFRLNTDVLNDAGKDHVKQIAARLQQHPDFLVLVERSLTSIDPQSEYQYPVNPNPELDMKRREVIVRSLAAMGVPDADQRVVVSHALTPGQKAVEAERDYQQQLNSFGGFGGLGGFGGFGGFGFGGGFGGFGGFF